MQILKNWERIPNFVRPQKLERVPRSNNWNVFWNTFRPERVLEHLWATETSHEHSLLDHSDKS